MPHLADIAAPPAASGRDTDWGQLYIVCIASFVVWAGFGAILPYLPVFLKEQAHASVWLIGVIAAGYFVGTFVFSTPLGRLSDTIGRKPVIVAGVVLYAVATLLFVSTTQPAWFLLFRFLEGVGAAAVGPAGQAFIADITTDENRSRAYGWLTTAQFGGLVAGPALAWPLYSLGGGEGKWAFYSIFLFGSAASAIVALVLLLRLKEPERGRRRRREKVKRPPLRTLLNRPILAFILVAAAGHFAMGTWDVIWSIYLRHLGASMAFVGWTWIAFSVPMLLSFVGGYIADRGNRFLLMFSGLRHLRRGVGHLRHGDGAVGAAALQRDRGHRHRLLVPGQAGVPRAGQPAALAGDDPGARDDRDAARGARRHPRLATPLQRDGRLGDRPRRHLQPRRSGHRGADPARGLAGDHEARDGSSRPPKPTGSPTSTPRSSSWRPSHGPSSHPAANAVRARPKGLARYHGSPMLGLR